MNLGEVAAKYAVVKFVIDNLYSEVPTSWLTQEENKQLCLWPPRTANTKILIANDANPNLETWSEYEVEIIKYCKSLESARKSAADSNYETTDDDTLGRGRRQHTVYNKFSSEENNAPLCNKTYKRKAVSNNKVISSIPSCPDSFTWNNICNNNDESEKNVNNDAINDDIPVSQPSGKKKICTNPSSFQSSEEICNISNIPIILQDGTSLSERMLEDSNTKMEYLREILRFQATSNLILQDIKQRIGRIEDVMKSRAPVLTKNNDTLIAQMLPLHTIEAIRNFDSLLYDTNEAVTQFKEFLLRIGGHNPRDNIYRILSKIFTNACAIKCSWKGIRNNFKCYVQ